MNARGRATRPWHCLIGLALLLLSGGAAALGLGEIRVLSRPGEPLLAEIPIISNEPGELENARARLASPETFERVGLEPPQGLVRDLQFEIARNAQGRAVVRVTSRAPVDAAALSFLVEVDWGQGRLVREYSALIDAPQAAIAVAEPQIEAPAAAPSSAIVREAPPPPPAEPAPSASAPAPAPAATSPAPVQMAAPGEAIATVQRGQTLSQIASRLDRGGYSLDQTMLALLRANPEAFIGGNIHRLKAGAVLRMPPAEALARLDRAAATALVREQTAQWRQARTLPQPADAAAVAGAGNRQAGAVQPVAAADARLEIAPAAAAEDTQAGTRSGGGAGGEGDMQANEQMRQLQEDLAARESEVEELRARLDELEKLQQQQQKLLEMKDSELAAAQQRLAVTQQASSGEGGAPLWLFGGLALLLAGGLAWWLARRQKPLPIPTARRSGYDAAALAAAMPAATAGSDPAAAADRPEEAHHAMAPADEAVPEPGIDDEAPIEVPPDAPPAAPPLGPQGPVTGAAKPSWHDPGLQVPGLTPLNPVPGGRERLELAVAYLELGEVETARYLLNEVVAGPDPGARDEAARLLREIG